LRGQNQGKTANGGVVTDAMGVLEIVLRVDTRVAGGSDTIASKNDFFFFFFFCIGHCCGL
jgi:hypothetical protein